MQCTTEASAQHRSRLRGESFSDNTSINNNNNNNNDDKLRTQATVASHDAPDGTANT